MHVGINTAGEGQKILGVKHFLGKRCLDVRREVAVRIDDPGLAAKAYEEVMRYDYLAITRGPLVYATGLIDGFKTAETLRLGGEGYAATVVDVSYVGPAKHLELDTEALGRLQATAGAVSARYRPTASDTEIFVVTLRCENM